jgi:hypothetical protein
LGFKYFLPRAPLLLLPILMIIWVNAHGGYMSGIALTLIFTVSEWINYLVCAARDPLQKRRLILLTNVAALTILTSLINPGFLDHWLYPFQSVGMASKNIIMEWQSPNFHLLGARIYLMTVLCFFLLTIYSHRKPDATEVIVPTFFIINGFIATRHIPLTALTILPFMGLAISQMGLTNIVSAIGQSRVAQWLKQRRGARVELGRGEFVLNWIMLWALVAGLFIGAPMFDASNGKRMHAALPVSAADFVEANGIKGRMFNSFDDGGYLIYRFWPNRKVFIDGRDDMYGDRFLADFMDIYEGKSNWKEKFDALAIDFAIVHKNAPIRQILVLEGAFKELFSDENFSVLLRRNPNEETFFRHLSSVQDNPIKLK